MHKHGTFLLYTKTGHFASVGMQNERGTTSNKKVEEVTNLPISKCIPSIQPTEARFAKAKMIKNLANQCHRVAHARAMKSKLVKKFQTVST
jgi:hypothetical protein